MQPKWSRISVSVAKRKPASPGSLPALISLSS
ncbi:Uncharacterised protein [Bordetella pertussis]|nr:Uncharacterised protein [Bordetella pertussis]